MARLVIVAARLVSPNRYRSATWCFQPLSVCPTHSRPPLTNPYHFFGVSNIPILPIPQCSFKPGAQGQTILLPSP